MEKLQTFQQSASQAHLPPACCRERDLSDALSDVQPGSVLDFRYFVTKIEPILAKPGADGKACVFCHASHVIFKLAPPNAEGVFSDQDSKENYQLRDARGGHHQPGQESDARSNLPGLPTAPATSATTWPRTMAASAGTETNPATSTGPSSSGSAAAAWRMRVCKNRKR